MTVSAINPFLPPPPDAGASTYGDILDSIFGNLSAADKQKIWVKFLTDNNLPQPVPPPGSEQLFLTYLNQVVTSEQFSQKVYVNDKLSPEEMKKRNIMFQVLNSVVSMLLSLQSTVTVQAQNIAIFARWQKEYTNMLTRVPTLVGGESSAVRPIDVNAPNPDWSQFTFGYNDISVQDIAKWWAQQRLDGKNDSFVISAPWQVPPPPAVGTSFGNTALTFSAGAISFTGAPFLPPVSVGISVTGTTFDQLVGNLTEAFKNFWNSYAGFVQFPAGYLQYNAYTTYMSTLSPGNTNPGIQTLLTWTQIFAQTKGITDPYAAIEILKPFTYVAPAGVTQQDSPIRGFSDAAAKARGEINSKEQQFTESIRSKRQIVQDTQSALQSNLDQSRQTYSQQSDLLTSLIDSLKGLLSSIFR